MVCEKRDHGIRDPIKLLLEESIMQQRNEMMDTFTLILRQPPMIVETPSKRNHFKGMTPFKE
jgi:hypothetical protein